MTPLATLYTGEKPNSIPFQQYNEWFEELKHCNTYYDCTGLRDVRLRESCAIYIVAYCLRTAGLPF